MIADSFVHAATLLVSVWLGIMFRKITLMPPDMNPLEGHLTARTRHKKAKSSASTVYTDYSNGKRTSTAHDSNRGSVQGFDEAPRGPTVPFHHTRARESVSWNNRDSRLDLPSRGYQMTPTTSARSSTYSQTSNLDSMPLGRSPNRGSYVGVPLDDLDDTHAAASPTRPTSQPKPGKFTENWTTSESLISRTQQRHSALAAQERDRAGRSYDAITERYGGYGDSEEEEGRVNVDILAGSDFEDDPAERRTHADPLRSHPASPPRTKKAYRGNVLSEMGLDGRNVSGSADITDTAGKRASAPAVAALQQQRYRNSSIQPEGDFLAKPYGDLRAATPPVIIGGGRQVSSGNDYDAASGGAFGRRNVSGKVAEEGQAGKAYSRFSMFG
ncbi:hypothetical protein IMZ48_38430 [Candidatus Bathyarchaeota archaeon]|nr:hypothetical protein [Candidatus Bathyarchaeota archaeon]